MKKGNKICETEAGTIFQAIVPECDPRRKDGEKFREGVSGFWVYVNDTATPIDKLSFEDKLAIQNNRQ